MKVNFTIQNIKATERKYHQKETFTRANFGMEKNMVKE